MPTRDQVLRLLESGLDHEAAGRALGVPAGQAYLIATGRPGHHLVGPEAKNPSARDSVQEWLAGRVLADRQMRRAAREREAAG